MAGIRTVPGFAVGFEAVAGGHRLVVIVQLPEADGLVLAASREDLGEGGVGGNVEDASEMAVRAHRRVTLGVGLKLSAMPQRDRADVDRGGGHGCMNVLREGRKEKGKKKRGRLALA